MWKLDNVTFVSLIIYWVHILNFEHTDFEQTLSEWPSVLLFHLGFCHSPSSPSSPPPSSGFLFFFQLFHCYLGKVTGESSVSSLLFWLHSDAD